jgi:hypothetical protein
VRSWWTPIGDQAEGDVTFEPYGSHDDAYQQGRMLACLNGIEKVEVYAPDETTRYEYERSDNVWRDLSSAATS